MFWKNKEKELRQKIDLNINEHNAAWLINEELNRMHTLFNKCMNTRCIDDATFKVVNFNLNIYWTKIQELQKKMVEYVAKAPDHDMQKSILDIQSELVDKIVLGDGDPK